MDILICVESWLNRKSAVSFPGFNCFRKDTPDGSAYGGIVIYLRKNLEFKKNNIQFSRNIEEEVEFCAINILNTYIPFTIIAFYQPGITLSQNT